MFKKITKDNITSLIESYRFISVFLTVIIYMVRGILEQYNVSVMIAMALCVIVATFLLHYLYKISYRMSARLHILLLIEIVGIAFLMLYTGGLGSPFIWCFLNPLLIISYYLHSRQKMLYLASNLILLCVIGYIMESFLGIREYLLFNSNIILSYILLLILVNILFEYHRRIMDNREELKNAYKDLISYNTRIKGMIQDMLFMYDAVQTVSERRDKCEIINIILDFAGRISPASNVFFILEDCGKSDCLIALHDICKDVRKKIIEKADNIDFDVSERHVAEFNIEKGIVAVFIRVSNIRNYGTFGFLTQEKEYYRAKNEYEANLLLISQLGATFFEKIEDEIVNNELIIADEQNRIADDIHDSVVQRLFAMSCFAYDTINKWEESSDESKKEQMTFIMETIQSSLKDLRSTIYNLSSKKQQIEYFKESVQNYLKDMERLSGVSISLEMEGSPDNLSLGARKALYRIITECTGNAIKHAKCRYVWIKMNISDEKTFLSIKDDGIGLNIEKAEREKNGLGLYNIKSLVRVFNGSISIAGEKDSGTTFDIEFLNSNIFKRADKEYLQG